jgi:aminoglycoside 6'-N-acetyltransferase I
MTIRRAEPADLAVLLELAADFYAEDGFTTPRDKLAEHLDHLATSDAARIAVADEDGGIVAFAISTSRYGLESGRIAELEDLYVVPAARRRGLAARLIEDSAAWARTIGAAHLEIVVAPNGGDPGPLLRYYAARGFVDEGRRLIARPL